MSRSRKKRTVRARAPAPPPAAHWRLLGPLVRQQKVLLRRWALGAIALTWLAWAATGLLTGQMSVLLSPAGPHHDSGIAAVLLAVAVLIGAGGVVLAAAEPCAAPDDGEPPCLRVRRALWATAAACFVAAYVADLGEGVLWFTNRVFPGILTGRELANTLAFDPVLSAARHASAGRDYDVLWAMGWVVGLTFVLAVVRALKVHRVATVVTLLLQWVPVHALWSLHVVAAIATGPWTNPDRSDLALRVDASWSYTLLTAFAGTWLLGIVGCLWMLLRALEPAADDGSSRSKQRKGR
jgi:hypothetical protein